MNTTFDQFHDQLGRATRTVLMLTLVLFGLTLGFALLGFPEVVASLRSVTLSVAFVFGALFVVFLLASLVGALIRWIDRRHRIAGQ
jgi:hypothetical protein